MIQGLPQIYDTQYSSLSSSHFAAVQQYLSHEGSNRPLREQNCPANSWRSPLCTGEMSIVDNSSPAPINVADKIGKCSSPEVAQVKRPMIVKVPTMPSRMNRRNFPARTDAHSYMSRKTTRYHSSVKSSGIKIVKRSSSNSFKSSDVREKPDSSTVDYDDSTKAGSSLHHQRSSGGLTFS